MSSRVVNSREIETIVAQQMEMLLNMSDGQHVTGDDVERWFLAVVTVLRTLGDAPGEDPTHFLRWARDMLAANVDFVRGEHARQKAVN